MVSKSRTRWRQATLNKYHKIRVGKWVAIKVCAWDARCVEEDGHERESGVALTVNASFFHTVTPTLGSVQFVGEYYVAPGVLGIDRLGKFCLVHLLTST